MTLAGNIEGSRLTGAAGDELGTIHRVLYQLTGTKVIGVMVRPTARMYVVERAETFLPLSALRFEGAMVLCDLKKLPTGRKAAAGLGHDPDATVIWTHMTVRGPSGESVGVLSDVDFDPVSGDVRAIEIAAGAVADTAHGRYVAPVRLVEGYRDGAIRIVAEASGLETSGGLAKTAAEGAVAATAAVKAGAVAASDAARAAGEALETTVVAASGATGRALKKVADAKVAEKAVQRVTGTWRDSVKAFREGRDGK